MSLWSVNLKRETKCIAIYMVVLVGSSGCAHQWSLMHTNELPTVYWNECLSIEITEIQRLVKCKEFPGSGVGAEVKLFRAGVELENAQGL